MSKLLVFALLIKTHTHTFLFGAYRYTWFCMYEDRGTNLCRAEEEGRKGKGKDRKGSISGLRLLF